MWMVSIWAWRAVCSSALDIEHRVLMYTNHKWGVRPMMCGSIQPTKRRRSQLKKKNFLFLSVGSRFVDVAFFFAFKAAGYAKQVCRHLTRDLVNIETNRSERGGMRLTTFKPRNARVLSIFRLLFFIFFSFSFFASKPDDELFSVDDRTHNRFSLFDLMHTFISRYWCRAPLSRSPLALLQSSSKTLIFAHSLYSRCYFPDHQRFSMCLLSKSCSCVCVCISLPICKAYKS